MKSGHDAAKHGYHKMEWSGDDKVNHRIEGAYSKQPSGQKSEKTEIHKKVKHMQQSKMMLDREKEADCKD